MGARRLRSALLAIVAINLALSLAALVVRSPPRPRIVPPSVSAVTVATGVPPVRVSIRAAGIEADIVPVGLTADRAVAVPRLGEVGWYERSAAIGERGSIVLVGHVDSRRGPDVFFGLHNLSAGDTVTLLGPDGANHDYVVRTTQLTAKTALPAAIFDRSTPPGLWLITCGGAFNRRTRSYESNQLVYAVPLEPNAIA